MPDWISGRAIQQRMEMLDNGGWDKATDADIAAHLFTASLVAPMNHDWAEIYIYTVAQLMPQLCDTTIPVPKELSTWQQQELNQLKHKIFERQNKGGLTVGTKVVLEEQADGILVGVIRDNTDPILKKVATAPESDLPTRMAAAALLVPAFISEAEAKWKDSPRNPAYKAPKKEEKKPEAKTEIKLATLPKTEKKDEVKKSENQGELPLLASDKTPETPETKADPPANPLAPLPEVAEKLQQIGRSVDAQIAEQRSQPPEPTTVKEAVKQAVVEAGGTPVVDEEVVLNAMEKAGVEISVTDEQEPAKIETIAPKTDTKSRKGETFELSDGRGPFNSIQEALDALGVDKINRPQHNRWDRLSKKLQEQILKA